MAERKLKYHSNKNLEFIKDDLKSYVYVKDKGKDIGMLCWDYNKKRWNFDRWCLQVMAG